MQNQTNEKKSNSGCVSKIAQGHKRTSQRGQTTCRHESQQGSSAAANAKGERTKTRTTTGAAWKELAVEGILCATDIINEHERKLENLTITLPYADSCLLEAFAVKNSMSYGQAISRILSEGIDLVDWANDMGATR